MVRRVRHSAGVRSVSKGFHQALLADAVMTGVRRGIGLLADQHGRGRWVGTLAEPVLEEEGIARALHLREEVVGRGGGVEGAGEGGGADGAGGRRRCRSEEGGNAA